MDNKPSLIEPGVKFFFKNTLEECRKVKDKHYSFVYNISLLIIFLLVVFSILYFKYKGNINLVEKKKKLKREKEYIMSKLIQISDYKKKNSENLITNLPNWNDNPEVSILNRNFY